jgi:hypothetical protein
MGEHSLRSLMNRLDGETNAENETVAKEILIHSADIDVMRLGA